ncbi:MAG TPA: acetate/propionate family kinase [Gemmatimonadaceae bacterium]|nr:acetate/propionate family kinase [Gemmatimonadaceae bacterium]
MRVLVLNCGSSSVKLQLVDASVGAADSDAHPVVARGGVRNVSSPNATWWVDVGDRHAEGELRLRDHSAAVRELLSRFREVYGTGEIDAVGHRIVHGGARYHAATIIDSAVLESLAELEELAPLHNGPCVAGVRAARDALGTNVPMTASFDTAFHHDLPAVAAQYAIPADLAETYQIRRYGFHGLSYQSVLARYCHFTGTPPERATLIVLHLGSGCSAVAIREGRAADTSMGFTPLEGLVMSTRSGDLDPAIVAFVAQHERTPASTVEQWLNTRSGLLGVSRSTGDMRELLAVERDDEHAQLAIEMFAYRARKYIGAFLAALGGAEAVVFTGGIGENSPIVRSRILDGMEWCGIRLDASCNSACVGAPTRVSAEDSRVAVYAIPTDEEGVIARDAVRLVSAAP